jgi:hypothetical protein
MNKCEGSLYYIQGVSSEVQVEGEVSSMNNMIVVILVIVV